MKTKVKLISVKTDEVEFPDMRKSELDTFERFKISRKQNFEGLQISSCSHIQQDPKEVFARIINTGFSV
jgi:hypothetical protein